MSGLLCLAATTIAPSLGQLMQKLLRKRAHVGNTQPHDEDHEALLQRVHVRIKKMNARCRQSKESPPTVSAPDKVLALCCMQNQ